MKETYNYFDLTYLRHLDDTNSPFKSSLSVSMCCYLIQNLNYMFIVGGPISPSFDHFACIIVNVRGGFWA